MRADARRNRARVLEAAEAVFAESGTSASTEEIALRAGVGIGTLFRHFATKQDLLEAILIDRVARLGELARSLGTSHEPGPALFDLVTRMVEQSPNKRSYVDALADASLASRIAKSDAGLDAMQAIGTVLARAQRVGAVRGDISATDLVALVVGTSRAAEHAGWDPAVLAKMLDVIFAGISARDQ